jgi:hypothetical protein
MSSLETLEQRFLKIADLSLDLSIFPIKQTVDTQVKTNKDKSKAHGEVFTPVWLVDKMIIKSLRNRSTKFPNTFLDLCAGYGQFSIRWLRCLKKIYDKKNKPFNVEDILKNQIYFSELQPSSCYKLISIFGIENINLFIGDATKLDKLNEEESYRGIYVFSSKKNKWINIDKIIHKILKDEEYFVKSFEDKIIPKI